MTMKEFTTAAKASADKDEAEFGEPLSFKVDDATFVALPPTQGEFAMLMLGATDISTAVETIGNAINFFFAVLDDEWSEPPEDEDDDGKRINAAKYLKRRLFDRRDGFDAEDIMQIVEWQVESWSGRPTKQPSDFKQSQRSGGRKSTAHARHAARTRSSSGQTASAT